MPKPPTSGRRKGTPNKLTLAARQFLAELMDDPEVQAGVRARILAGDTVAFFRAVEHVIGKPRERVDVTTAGPITLCWAGEEEHRRAARETP